MSNTFFQGGRKIF